jgi:hypothetical protein
MVVGTQEIRNGHFHNHKLETLQLDEMYLAYVLGVQKEDLVNTIYVKSKCRDR